VIEDDTGNPYLREFLRLKREIALAQDFATSVHGARRLSAYERRVWLVRRYAFAVPNEAALSTLARYAPLVELGAGNGYWAYLLRQRGVDCVAYDTAPPDRADNPHRFARRTWTTIEQGDVQALAAHADRALLLCWPGYRDPSAAQALEVCRWRTVLYIGEPPGGHTADEAFHARLAEAWELVEEVALPNWPGTRDRLTVHRLRA